MADTLEEDCYEEEPGIPESEVKAALNVLGRNTSPGVDGIPAELFQPTLSAAEEENIPQG